MVLAAKKNQGKVGKCRHFASWHGGCNLKADPGGSFSEFIQTERRHSYETPVALLAEDGESWVRRSAGPARGRRGQLRPREEGTREIGASGSFERKGPAEHRHGRLHAAGQ